MGLCGAAWLLFESNDSFCNVIARANSKLKLCPSMGKSDTSVAAEFFKLELLLVQTADDAIHCVKTLKDNLAEYDIRHGLHFTNTSKSFMRGFIRAAKDAASDLRLAADQVAKSKYLSDWEIAAARNKMNAASDAMKGAEEGGSPLRRDERQAHGHHPRHRQHAGREIRQNERGRHSRNCGHSGDSGGVDTPWRVRRVFSLEAPDRRSGEVSVAFTN